MKALSRENAAAGAVAGSGGVMAGMAGNDGSGVVPAAARVPLRELMDDRLLDALLERSRDQAGGLRLTGEGSMLGELVRAVLERALESELTAHLGYERNEQAGRGAGNSRNGTIAKTVQTGVGPVPLQVPRDRAGTFEPLLVPKRAGRVAGGLDDMVISLYAHGMSVRDIMHHLEQVYGTQLSHETVSRITDAVLEEVRPGDRGRWSRSTRRCSWTPSWSRSATTRSCRTSPPTSPSASTATGRSTCWASGWPRRHPETATAGEGARFWGSVMNDLRNRGVRDILIACCDGLAGFEDAITGAFPRTVVQRWVPCAYRGTRCAEVARRDAGEVAKELRKIYTAPAAEAAFKAPSPRSPPRPGGRSTRRPSGSGRTPGTPSPRSWPSARPCASCSTRPTRSRA